MCICTILKYKLYIYKVINYNQKKKGKCLKLIPQKLKITGHNVKSV